MTPLNRAHLVEKLVHVLEAAQEELRLLRMKDTATVYDSTLRVRISEVLREVKEAQI